MATPDVLPVQVADLAGGAWPAALQVVAALYQRDASGAKAASKDGTSSFSPDVSGRLIDVNMAVGAHATLTLPISRLAVANAAANNPGENNQASVIVGRGADMLCSPHNAAYGVFSGSDGERLALGALEPHFWEALAAIAGLNDDGEKSLTLQRGLTDPSVRRRLEDVIAERPAAEWAAKLRAAGVPATVIIAPEASMQHVEELTGCRVHVNVHISGGDESSGGTSKPTVLRLPTTPLDLGTPAATPAPALGASNTGPVFRN